MRFAKFAVASAALVCPLLIGCSQSTPSLAGGSKTIYERDDSVMTTYTIPESQPALANTATSDQVIYHHDDEVSYVISDP